MKNIAFFIGLTILNMCHISHSMIVEAAYKGSVGQIKCFRSLGFDINETSPGDKTPLQIACEKGYVDVVDFLLCCPEIKINECDSTKQSALHYVIENMATNPKLRDIMRLLINHHGTDINLLNGYYRDTPLHSACNHRNQDAVEELLFESPKFSDRKCNINAQNRDGKTPLDIAYTLEIALHSSVNELKTSLTRLIKILIQHGANTNRAGKAPIHIACENNWIDIINLLLEQKCDINARDKNLNTALHVACEKNYLDLVEILLQHDADTKKTNKDNVSPLQIACEKDHVDIVELLLRYEPSLTKSKHRACGTGPLHWAADRCSMQTMRLLLTNPEIDKLQKDYDGQTPLMYSCTKGHIEGSQLLLQTDSENIDAQNCYGNTALHLVALNKTNNLHDIVQLLIKYGVSMVIKNNKQHTPLAEFFRRNEIAPLDPATLQQMVTATDGDGNTQLHLYTETQKNNHVYRHDPTVDDYIAFLIRNGLSIWSRNEYGQTAAELAHDNYCAAQEWYLEKPLPHISALLENQERTLHSFLRATSCRTSCGTFKEFFKEVGLTQDAQQHIMKWYYKLNAETIIARQYKDNDNYYASSLTKKDVTRKRVIKKLSNPRLLWADEKLTPKA